MRTPWDFGFEQAGAGRDRAGVGGRTRTGRPHLGGPHEKQPVHPRPALQHKGQDGDWGGVWPSQAGFLGAPRSVPGT